MNYQLEYDNLISYRKSNILEKSTYLYTETHHILPRSLGGTDDEDNLVELTGEEHYKAHYYLYHCYEIGTIEYTKAINAFNIMNKGSKHKGRYYDPKLYQELREDRRNNFKVINLNSLKDICKWIDMNGELSHSSKDNIERKRYRLIKRLVEYRNSKHHLWYEEYKELVESLGHKDLFKDLYQVTIDNINELCDFIIKNGRNPIPHKEDYLYKKIDNLRRRKRVNKTWNKDFDNLLKERSCFHIFDVIDYKKEMIDKINKLCDFIDENGMPNYERDNYLYKLLHNLKRAKIDKYGQWNDEYQKIVESRGYPSLFEFNDIEGIMLKRINDLCDFKDKFNKNPSQYSSDKYEKSLYYLLGDLKKKKKKPNSKWFDSFDDLVESRGYKDLFKVNKRVKK